MNRGPLACFVNSEAAHGYAIGRQWYFVDAQPDEERTYTDTRLIERLQGLERQSVEFHDEEDTWYHSLGCILGELSGQLFPMTAQDTALWQELERQFWAQVQATPLPASTRPGELAPVGEYPV